MLVKTNGVNVPCSTSKTRLLYCLFFSFSCNNNNNDNNVAKKVHWDFCKKNGLEHTEKWYEPEGVVENKEVKVLWDINVRCDNVTEARRPDIIVIDKKERKGLIIDIAVPADVRVEEKEREKVEKYQDLKREIGRLWNLKKVEVVPVVIGALGSVTKEFDRWIEKLGITFNVEVVQKTALLGTARILRIFKQPITALNKLIDSQHYKRHKRKRMTEFHSPSHFILAITQLKLSSLTTLKYSKMILKLVQFFRNHR